MPDAPRPVYNSNHQPVGGWSVRADYDEASDSIWVVVKRPGGRWLKSKITKDVYAPQDLEDVVAALQVAVRTLGARRLF